MDPIAPQPSPADGEEEIALAGGMGSDGQVVRVGDTVRRPWRPESDTVHAFLDHLHRVGFEGAPRHLRTDDQGRAVLTWLEGDVGVPPFPDWTTDEALLVSVAQLQRRLHEASATFVPAPDATWQVANLPPPGPGAIWCHNDLCIENVVVRGGRAVAFIDFDFLAPADPLIDIAIAARHWVPVRAAADLEPNRQDLDQVARFRTFCEVHELTKAQRSRVVAAGMDFLDRALVTMKDRADSGLRLYVAAWEGGYADQNRRSHAWLRDHADAIAR